MPINVSFSHKTTPKIADLFGMEETPGDPNIRAKDFPREAAIIDESKYEDYKGSYFQGDGNGYHQGQISGQTVLKLCFITPINITRFQNDSYSLLEELNFIFLDSNNELKALHFFIDPSNPKAWGIAFSRQTHLPEEQQNIDLYFSDDFEIPTDSTANFVQKNKTDLKLNEIKTKVLQEIQLQAVRDTLVLLINSLGTQRSIDILKELNEKTKTLHPPWVEDQDSSAFLKNQGEFKKWISEERAAEERAEGFKIFTQVWIGSALTFGALAGIMAAVVSTAAALSVISLVFWPVLVPAVVLGVTYAGFSILNHRRKQSDRDDEPNDTPPGSEKGDTKSPIDSSSLISPPLSPTTSVDTSDPHDPSFFHEYKGEPKSRTEELTDRPEP